MVELQSPHDYWPVDRHAAQPRQNSSPCFGCATPSLHHLAPRHGRTRAGSRSGRREWQSSQKWVCPKQKNVATLQQNLRRRDTRMSDGPQDAALAKEQGDTRSSSQALPCIARTTPTRNRQAKRNTLSVERVSQKAPPCLHLNSMKSLPCPRVHNPLLPARQPPHTSSSARYALPAGPSPAGAHRRSPP